MIFWWSAWLAGAAVLAWLLLRLWRIAAIGSAYKAKVLASVIYGTGRPTGGRVEEVSADSYWPLRLFREQVDHETRSVRVSLVGLRSRAAVYRDGLGATLTCSTALAAPPAALAAASGRQAVASPPPAATAALDHVVGAAFAEPNPRRLRRTRAIVVIQHGRLLAEHYAPGFSAATRFAGWSMTKSVLGALVGILVGDGRLSLDATALLPEWQDPDPRAGIRLEDLLRMRSGLRFSEDYSDFSSDVIEMLFNRPDAARYAAGQPLLATPGTVWSYSSGTTNILSSLIRRTVGDREYLEWPRRTLFDPLGMDSALMEPDASGTFVGSSFMLATARDWARVGELYLQGGVWEGWRILPDQWVQFCTTPTAESPDGIYGAHWWLGLKPEIGGGTPAATRLPPSTFHAVGHEGQVLTVIPALDAVVVRLGLSVHIDAWDHAGFLANLIDALQDPEGGDAGPPG